MNSDKKESILIIGGGLIGLSLAYEFAKKNSSTLGHHFVVSDSTWAVQNAARNNEQMFQLNKIFVVVK